MERKYVCPLEPEDNSKYALSVPVPAEGLLDVYDLSKQAPDPWDQGQTGTCVLHGTGATIWSAHVRAGVTPFKPSILFPYFNGRRFEGTLGQDNGMYVHDAYWVGHEFGIVPDSVWPFDPAQMETVPPQSVYDEAAKDIAKNYASVNLGDVNAIKLAFSHKLPVSFGMDVYRTFEEIGKDGIMPMPGRFERFMGRHCMCNFGRVKIGDSYFYKVLNSWGPDWADHGFVYIPEEYMLSQHTADGWVYRL